MKTKMMRGLVGASALLLAVAFNPATAQSPDVKPSGASTSAPSEESGLNPALVALAGLAAVMYLGLRRAR